MGEASVLVVDDDQPIASAYAEQLRPEYAVDVAHDGPAALEAVGPGTDVVLLDRRMPTLSGKEVLDRIRDRGLDCRVAMLTGVEPDFDVLEMPFDDYLLKPVDAGELHEVVDTLLARSALDDQLREYYRLLSKKATLAHRKSAEELSGHEEYQRLLDRAERLRERLDATYERLDERQAFMAALDGTSA